MDIDGYTAKRDDDFPYSEQYWVYHDGSLVGWIRYHCGILAATHVASKEGMLPSPFLVHALYGPDPDDYFPTGVLRRAALRKCLKEIAKHYGDKRDPVRMISAMMGPVEVLPMEQASLFGDSNA